MRKLLAFTAVALLCTASLASAQVTATSPANLSLTVANEANISIDATTNFNTPNTTFTDYTATTNYHYQVRTTKVSGSGFISVAISVANDFGPGGPSANSPAAGDSLKITSSTASVGTTAVPANQINATAQNIVTFGTDAHAGSPGPVGSKGATGSVAWNLTNDPAYVTGSYTATATFTVSAT
jgi:hypothetical protein